ncbi:MAG: amino acid adenylation domain-containing protein, partial [Deltaproteobacteria bacterium]|nr:amino acid adenylation domain-containing protein [Deltaproteobacteria bacterium]
MEARSLFELVASAASRFEDKTAVFGEAGSLCFKEMLSGALGVAQVLQQAGIGRGDRVGLWMEKSPRSVQALLGILAAGAAYVPLDPRAPWRRGRVIAEDCRLSALFVDEVRLPALPSLVEGLELRLLVVDAPRCQELPRLSWTPFSSCVASPPSAQAVPIDPDDVAYILYTSGSTGTPKGVVHTHASGLSFVRWVQERFAIRPDDVFSSHAPFHFDLSISDLYASLGAGAQVRLFNSTEAMLAPHLVRALDEDGITVWYSVPSILVSMLDAGLERRRPRRLRTLFFAGEVFPTPQLKRLRRALPDVTLANLFGPTETNVCTYYEVPAQLEGEAPIPIGKGCENLETFVVDDEGQVVAAPGQEGTLWVRGANLMQGYWNDSQRTARLLQTDPRGVPGMACCTGDRVKLQPDGDYEFRGRRDHLVKTRGYRVELGDIEAALASHPEVREAVAVPLPDQALGNRIVATGVPRAGATPDGKSLRVFCSERLP